MHSSWGYPFLLLVVGFGTYLYPLTQLGYYWDDWEVVYLTHLANWKDLMGYFWFDRPFAWPYLIYDGLGVNPLNWHLLTFFLRFGAILFLYYSFLYLWPSRKYELRWMGLLLLVFPGFLQQSISTAYSRHFTSLFLFSLSLYLTARAVRGRSNNRFYWICSFLIGALQIFTIEYYAALELIRPVFLWFLLDETRWKKLRKVAVLWAPFLAAFLAFISWRIFHFPASLASNRWSKSISLLDRSAAVRLPNLAQKFFSDVFHLVFQSWFDKIYDPSIFNFAALITFVAIFLAVILALFSILTLSRSENGKDQFVYQALILGTAGLLLGGLPVWAIGKNITGGGRWDDRFSQAPMIGAVLLTVVITSILVRIRWQSLVLSIMLASAIVTQVVVVNKYRLDWQYQKSLYWQMYWRAPALSQNTAIYSQYIPSYWLPDYDASFAFSALYTDHQIGTKIPYWFFTSEQIAGMKIQPGKSISVSRRNIRFVGNGSDGIAIFYQPTKGCLRVLDPVFRADPIFTGYPSNLFSLSNLERIQPTSSHSPNEALFGSEPSSDWCYYFEKADLARQFHSWDTAINLYMQAKSLGLSAYGGGEYMPFIEAFARQNNFGEAVTLTVQAQKLTPGLKPLLCANWQNLQVGILIPGKVLLQVQSALGCSW